jgi:hypothetical protein
MWVASLSQYESANNTPLRLTSHLLIICTLTIWLVPKSETLWRSRLPLVFCHMCTHCDLHVVVSRIALSLSRALQLYLMYRLHDMLFAF